MMPTPTASSARDSDESVELQRYMELRERFECGERWLRELHDKEAGASRELDNLNSNKELDEEGRLRVGLLLGVVSKVKEERTRLEHTQRMKRTLLEKCPLHIPFLSDPGDVVYDSSSSERRTGMDTLARYKTLTKRIRHLRWGVYLARRDLAWEERVLAVSPNWKSRRIIRHLKNRLELQQSRLELLEASHCNSRHHPVNNYLALLRQQLIHTTQAIRDRNDEEAPRMHF